MNTPAAHFEIGKLDVQLYDTRSSRAPRGKKDFWKAAGFELLDAVGH